jgi:hypothetical protein
MGLDADDFRKDVRRKRDKAWSFQGDKDIYSGFTSMSDLASPEVDHIVECQALLDAYVFAFGSDGDSETDRMR